MEKEKMEELILLQIKINKLNTEMISSLNQISRIQNTEIVFLRKKIEKIDKIIVGMTINN